MKQKQKGKKICIYCMGDYGLQVYFKLKEYGIEVECFGDRDSRKQGYALDNIWCKSYEEVLEFDKDKTVIIVALKEAGNIVQHFKEQGFKFVYSKEYVFEKMKNMCKTKQIPIKDIEEVAEIKKTIENAIYTDNQHIYTYNDEVKQMIFDYSMRKRGK